MSHYSQLNKAPSVPTFYRMLLDEKSWKCDWERTLQLLVLLQQARTVSAWPVTWLYTVTMMQPWFLGHGGNGLRKSMPSHWNRQTAGAIGRKITAGCIVELFLVRHLWQDLTYFIMGHASQSTGKFIEHRSTFFQTLVCPAVMSSWFVCNTS